MSLLDDTELGFLLLGVSLFCLGSWPALLHLCPKETDSPDAVESTRLIPEGGSEDTSNSQQQQQQQRDAALALQRLENQCYTQLDLATTFFIVAVIPFAFAAILGDNNLEQILSGISFRLLACSVLGGGLLAFGQLVAQWSLAEHGPPLPSSVAIQSCLALLVALFFNYQVAPSHTKRDDLLLLAVLCFFVAIACYARTHKHVVGQPPPNRAQRQRSLRALRRQQRRKGNKSADDDATIGTEVDDTTTGDYDDEEDSKKPAALTDAGEDAPSETGGDPLASPKRTRKRGAAKNETEAPQPQRQRRGQSCPEILAAISSGLAFGFFSPAFNIAVNDPFGWSPDSGSLLAGQIFAVGIILQFQGAKKVSFVAAELVQAHPVLLSLWSLCCRSTTPETSGAEGEAPNGSRILRLVCLHVFMYAFYGLAISFLVFSHTGLPRQLDFAL